MDDFTRYQKLAQHGASVEEVYRAAKQEGLGSPAVIRLLRSIYGLTFVEAKEVMIKADTGLLLSDYQEQFLDGLKKASLDDAELEEDD